MHQRQDETPFLGSLFAQTLLWFFLILLPPTPSDNQHQIFGVPVIPFAQEGNYLKIVFPSLPSLGLPRLNLSELSRVLRWGPAN